MSLLTTQTNQTKKKIAEPITLPLSGRYKASEGSIRPKLTLTNGSEGGTYTQIMLLHENPQASLKKGQKHFDVFETSPQGRLLTIELVPDKTGNWKEGTFFLREE